MPLGLKMIQSGPKILFWDIETAPMQAWVWGRKEQWIPQENIEQKWFIICASWKWEGKDEIHSVSVLDSKKRFKKDHTNDYRVLRQIYKTLEYADILVHHNGDSFDLKRTKTRGLHHGLGPLPKIKTVDTLKQARKHFNFPSNKLDDIAEYFGLARKHKVSMEDFIGCAKGDEEAIKRIIEYNKQDINIQEAVFQKIRPYIDIPNMALWMDIEHLVCPSCGSEDKVNNGTSLTTSGKYQRHKCKNCRKTYRGKRMLSSVEGRPE